MQEAAYLAHPRYVPALAEELGAGTTAHGRLLIQPGPARPASWAQNVWLEPVRTAVRSIGEAAEVLRAIQRNWIGYAPILAGRSRLLSERLPHVSGKPLVFGQAPPRAPLGSFTWLSKTELLHSARCTSSFPNGEVQFVEDRRAPPNRAYLKLWEALTLCGRLPAPGELCLDLGSSPGGWTWVLQQLGARVISVDKAPLDPGIAALPNVEFRRESAFAIDPTSFERVDWLCCDVACYPARLLALVERWRAGGRVRNFICTIKLQGAPDAGVLAAFRAVAYSRLEHLWHNKHELTWICLADTEP